MPIAAHAVLADSGRTLLLDAALGGPDGQGGVTLLRAHASGPANAPEALGVEVAELLLARGGGPLLEAARLSAGGLPAPKIATPENLKSRGA